MRARRITIEVLIVLAVTGLIAVILTWPLAANFGTIIAGGGSAGDNTGYLWDMWSNSRYGLDLWGTGLQTHVGVPFGRTIIGGANLLLFFYVGPAWALASIFPTIVAYNIITLTGLALAGSSMYLLIRWLGLGVGAASWAGLAFEIFPYELQRTAAFPPLGLIQFAPLLIMAAVFWLQRPSWRRALLLAAAVLFPWLSNPYFGAMALVALGVTLIVGAVVFARRTNWVTSAKRLGEAVGMFIIVVAIPLAAIVGSTKGVAASIATRQRIELELYGAHLGDYIKPLPGMYLMSGIFGSADNWPVVSPGGERIAFLGWSVIILAVIGLVLAWRWRARLGQRVRIAVILAIPLVVAMTIFSLASPYPIFGSSVPMPSSLIFDYSPFLRVYARFALFVMAAVLVLAALGLSLLMRGRSFTWRACILSTAIIITAMELPLSLPVGTGVPFTVNGMTPEQVPTWRWLAAHDKNAVVIESPAFPNEVLDRQFLYGQTVHGHPLANGSLNEPGLVSDFLREYGNPTFPAAPATYAAAGIKYVVVNPWAWQQFGLQAPEVMRPPQGYRLVADFPDGSGIWRVTAVASRAFAFPSQGWSEPKKVDGVYWRYLADTATYTTYAPRATSVTIRFTVQGVLPSRPYALAVALPNGTTRTFPVTGSREVTLRTALPRGTSTFRLSVSGTAPHRLSTGDPRTATIRVSPWRIT